MILFNEPLTSSFQASDPLLLTGDTFTLDWAFRVATAASIQWYLEFSETGSDDNTDWFRETAQEDNGAGSVSMPIVVRTMIANMGGTLGAGDYRLNTQFVRRHKFARVQVRAASGSVTGMQISSPFGIEAQAPG